MVRPARCGGRAFSTVEGDLSAHDFDKEKNMAVENKAAKEQAAPDKHEIDPKRKAALDTALAQVEKSFGKGSAMRLGDRPEQNVEVISTGSLALDMALGIGWSLASDRP